jgi:AcrR family transcriptional regulator
VITADRKGIPCAKVPIVDDTLLFIRSSLLQSFDEGFFRFGVRMAADVLVAFEPRKRPIQARSAVTVEAISEATIQILLSYGEERLTTTRIAERAGVSVGTLYQYFPNKQSLLFAVLEHHMNTVAARVETACVSAHHKPLAEMIREMVEAVVDAKMEHVDISVALYRVSADVGGTTLTKRASQRLRKAVEAMLQTAQMQSRRPTNSPST